MPTSNYCVSFRLADKVVNGKTYDERRELLIENARADKMGFWDETSSFMLVESTLSTPDFAARICKGLSKDHDMVFVFDCSDMSANYFGPIKFEDVLQSFFTRAKKLP